MTPELSFVIPFLNEEATLRPLFEQIEAVMAQSERTHEFIFVDDGSVDGSAAVVEALAAEHPSRVSLVQLRSNFGKSAALSAGFAEARGAIVFTLDADLQDDPKEIPRFLEALETGYDLVSGYKKKRNDPITKVFPSRVFNWLVRRVTKTKLHDVNCGFKAYRRSVVENVRLYGELHRFVPILAHARGFKIGEIEVTHHPRRHGVTKFGGGRFFRGLMDLLTVYFLLRYERRPAHFFGAIGITSSLVGFAVCTYLSVLWFMGEPIGTRPLLTLGVLLIIVGIQFLATGLIGELLVHIYSSSDPSLSRRVIRPTPETSTPGLAPRTSPSALEVPDPAAPRAQP